MTQSTRTVREVTLFKKKKKPKPKSQAQSEFELTYRSLAKAGFSAVFTNIVPMVLILWFPILVSVMVAYGQWNMAATVPLPFWSGFDFLTKLILFSSVVIAIQRFLLLEERPKFPGFKFSKRELNAWICNLAICGWVLFILALPLALMYASVWAMDNYPDLIWWRVMMSLFGFIFLAGACLALDAWTRLFFALPTVALDQPGAWKDRLTEALKFGSGYAFTLAGAFCLAVVPFLLAIFALSFVPPSNGFGLMDVLAQVMGWLFAAVIIALYAVAYRAIEKDRAEKPES